MMTLIAEIPRLIATTSARPRQTPRDAGATCQSERARRRTRRDLLRMLAGSDGGSFPRRPRSRLVRSNPDLSR